jgi:hypothetical protein
LKSGTAARGATAKAFSRARPDATLPELLAAHGEKASPVFCCGHTHQPLIRSFGNTLIVNAGAAGLPFDGDARGSWALLDFAGGAPHAEIRRVAYDIEACLNLSTPMVSRAMAARSRASFGAKSKPRARISAVGFHLRRRRSRRRNLD